MDENAKSAYGVAFAILQDREASRLACHEALLLSTGESRLDAVRCALTLSLARAQNRVSPLAEDDADGWGTKAQRQRRFGDSELRGRVAAAMRALSPVDRALVVLCDVERLSYREIAEAVGSRVDSVEYRLWSARRTLYNRLKSLVRR